MKLTKKEIKEVIRDEARKRGALGGKSTLRKHGSEFFSKIGKKKKVIPK